MDPNKDQAEGKEAPAPVKQVRCPVCGGADGKLRTIVEEVERDKKIPPGSYGKVVGTAIPIFNPASLLGGLVTSSFKFPTIFILLEICASCNTVYSRGEDVKWQEIPVQFMPPGPRKT